MKQFHSFAVGLLMVFPGLAAGLTPKKLNSRLLRTAIPPNLLGIYTNPPSWIRKRHRWRSLSCTAVAA